MSKTETLIPTDRPLVPQLRDGQTVKVIGQGGVGGVVTRYGALLLAPLARGKNARFVLVDGDHFEPTNATRMLFSECGNKAAVTLAELMPRFAQSDLTMLAVEEYVERKNIARLIREEDIVLLCVDNHATRKLVSDHCATLRNVVLISGGNDGVGEDTKGRFHQGTYANCQIYIRRDGEDCSPSLTEYHTEIEDPKDDLPTEQNCTEAILTTPQLVLANLAAGSAILNALWLYLCGALHYSELAVDIADGLMRPIGLPAPKLPHAEPEPVGAPAKPR